MNIFARPFACGSAALFLAAFGVPGLAATAEAVEIQKVVSPGGIEALLVEDYTNPLIAMNFAFEGGGSTQDESGKEGTGNLLSGLLDEGAGEIESREFQERLDELGVSMSFNAGYDSFGGSFRTLVENEDEAFELLRLALNEPRFDEEPVNRIRSQIATGIIASQKDPGELASEAWRETIFPGHPYSRPIEGTLESLNAITVEDLESYRERSFAQDNLYVGVVGAISPEELGRRLDEVFGGLPEKADITEVADVEPVIGERTKVDLDVPQTSINFALPGVMRDDEDFFAAYLMNHILGGGSFTSRLYEEIREKRGLAYGAGSWLSTYDHAAVLGGGTATRSDMADESIAIIRQELEKMAEEGPTAEELEKAKSFVKGAYAIRNLDSSPSIAATLVGIQLEDLGMDYIDRRDELIDAVTLEEVRTMAKRLLSQEPTIVTVGPVSS